MIVNIFNMSIWKTVDRANTWKEQHPCKKQKTKKQIQIQKVQVIFMSPTGSFLLSCKSDQHQPPASPWTVLIGLIIVCSESHYTGAFQDNQQPGWGWGLGQYLIRDANILVHQGQNDFEKTFQSPSLFSHEQDREKSHHFTHSSVLCKNMATNQRFVSLKLHHCVLMIPCSASTDSSSALLVTQ